MKVIAPLFVLGPPRSGTTHLHRVLANDERYTTFRTWECLFGLSVTARKLGLWLARLDALLGRPVSRAAGWLGQKLFRPMDAVHPLELDAPEEDFLCLMPPLACFLLVVPFPRATWLWRLARFDTLATPRERKIHLAYYRAMLQKHLYVHGTDKQLLSKNASFSGMAETLLGEFPDARILACVRDPLEVVPSQLSALRPALAASGFDAVSPTLRDSLIDLLRFYYLHLARVADTHPGKLAFLRNTELRGELKASVTGALAAIGRPADEALTARLTELAGESREFRSAHQYSLDEFDLSADLIKSRFARVYQYFRF